MALAILALLLGAAVLSYTINSDGLELSFPLLLGALLVADGVIRLMLHQLHEPAKEATDEQAS